MEFFKAALETFGGDDLEDGGMAYVLTEVDETDEDEDDDEEDGEDDLGDEEDGDDEDDETLE